MNPLLLDYLNTQRLALFLGADLPGTLTGLPTRHELAATIARRAGLTPSANLAAVAQRMHSESYYQYLISLLREELDLTQRQPQPIHQLIVQLGFPTIITTCYDGLLELAFRQAQIAINPIVRDSDLAFSDPRSPTLIKLYGDLQQLDTLVITEDDHADRLYRREGILQRLRDTISRMALLFIGYDLSDPGFLALWREVLGRMGNLAIKSFALVPGMPAEQQRIWASRNIQIIDAEPLAFLQELQGIGRHQTRDTRHETQDLGQEKADDKETVSRRSTPADGTITTITGNVHGPVLSGTFSGPVSIHAHSAEAQRPAPTHGHNQKSDVHYTILAAFAQPRDLTATSWQYELRELRAILMPFAQYYHLETLTNCTAQELYRALLHYSPTILHFQGHGSAEGLVFEDAMGDIFRVSWQALMRTLASCPSLRCVVLNACDSQVHTQMQGQPFHLISMPGSVSSELAREFTNGFYEALIAGRSIPQAYQAACNLLALSGFPETEWPVLSEGLSND